MGRISLQNRTKGPWAGFERQVIGQRHTGWVEFIGERKVRLRKSPFLPVPSGAYYILPDDAVLYDGEYVQFAVSPRRLSSIATRVNGVLVDKGDEYNEVESIERQSAPHIPTYLKRDDFLSRITVNWKDADRDHLDKAMALQMLSCPASLIGPGGIGSQSFSVQSARDPLKKLRTSISLSLPVEFTTPNRFYEFAFLESLGQAQRLRERYSRRYISEASFNYLTFVDTTAALMPIQIPTIIRNSVYKGREHDADPDVLDYLLSALMTKPVVDESMVTDMERNLKFVIEEIQPEYSGEYVPIDRNALNRLAMAICRLEQKPRMDDTAFSQAKNWFVELYREFADLRLSIFPRGADSWVAPRVSVSYAQASLGPHDVTVLREIMRISREEGKEYVSRSELIPALRNKVPANLLDSSLERLVNNGFVITRENGTLFKPLRSADLDPVS